MALVSQKLHVHLVIQRSDEHNLEYYHGDNWRAALGFLTYYDRPVRVKITMVSICQKPERWQDIPVDDNDEYYEEEDE